MNNSIMNGKARISDTMIKIMIYISAGFSVILLIGIISYVFIKGIGSVNLQFLTTTRLIQLK